MINIIHQSNLQKIKLIPNLRMCRLICIFVICIYKKKQKTNRTLLSMHIYTYLEVLFCLGGKALGGGINVLSLPFMVGADMDMTGGAEFSLTRMMGGSSGVSMTGLRIGIDSSLPAYSRSSGVSRRRRA